MSFSKREINSSKIAKILFNSKYPGTSVRLFSHLSKDFTTRDGDLRFEHPSQFEGNKIDVLFGLFAFFKGTHVFQSG